MKLVPNFYSVNRWNQMLNHANLLLTFGKLRNQLILCGYAAHHKLTSKLAKNTLNAFCGVKATN